MNNKKNIIKKVIKNKKFLCVVMAVAVVIGVIVPIIYISCKDNSNNSEVSTSVKGNGFEQTIIAVEKKTQEETDTVSVEESTDVGLEQIYSDKEVEEFFDEEISMEDADALPVKPRTLTSESIPYDGVPRNISCWGDSMTEGFKTTSAKIVLGGIKKDISYATYPSVLQSFNGIKTYNLGVSGENSREVASRQGGWKMYTSEDFTVSAGSGSFSEVISEDGDSISLSDFSGYYFNGQKDNLCKIGDYWGYLTRSGDGYTFVLQSSASHASSMALSTNIEEKAQADRKPTPTVEDITVTQEGISIQVSEDIFIPAGTQVKTAASIERADDILIIEMGSNGGWRYNYQTLIEQYDAMIESVGCKYYIIIGDTDDPGEDDDGNYIGLGDTRWEATLREAYGDHFINMRTYLIENALSDCGLKTNKKDLKAFAKGYLSSKIRSDVTHFNAYGYYSKGIGIYKKGVELGYWK